MEEEDKKDDGSVETTVYYISSSGGTYQGGTGNTQYIFDFSSLSFTSTSPVFLDINDDGGTDRIKILNGEDAVFVLAYHTTDDLYFELKTGLSSGLTTTTLASQSNSAYGHITQLIEEGVLNDGTYTESYLTTDSDWDESALHFVSGETAYLVFGTDSADSLDLSAVTNSEDDINIFGRAGNDTIKGSLYGENELYGGAGDDSLYGGNNDTSSGSSNSGHSDELMGGDGSDYLYGYQGHDHLYGNTDVTLTDGDTDYFVYTASTEGAYVGTNYGYDEIHGFEVGTDKFSLEIGTGMLESMIDDGTTNDALDFYGTANNATSFLNGAYEALYLTGLSNLYVESIAAHINQTCSADSSYDTYGSNDTLSATTNDDGLIVATDGTNTSIYYYLESSAGPTTVSASELTFLAHVNDAVLTSSDFSFVDHI